MSIPIDVTLDLDGWRKIISVTNYVYDSGQVTIDLPPPLPNLIPQSGPMPKLKIMSVNFQYKGRRDGAGRKIFEWYE